MNKLIWGTLGLGIVDFVLVISLILGGGVGVGGDTDYDSLNVTDGYKVDGTEIINTSGVFTGAITSSNAVTLSGTVGMSATTNLTGTTRITDPVTVGAVTATTVSSTQTLTAAQICDSGINTIENASSSGIADGGVGTSTTLPTADKMFADCITTVGDLKSVIIRNIGTAASTTWLVAASASTTLVGQAATDDYMAGATEVVAKFIKAASNEMLVIVEKQIAAD